MYKQLLGRKLGMTTLFSPDGNQVPATVLEVGPCVVTQIKTRQQDGYDALQVGFVAKELSRLNKPMQGHVRKSGKQGYRFLREIPVNDPAAYELGQALTVDGVFQVGERVDVSGVSKGRGFSGVIKRWGFHGGRDTHGSMFHRAPGSVGASATPSKVIKGRKLPGRYGTDRVTVRNVEIVDVRTDQNVLIIKGAVPGSRSGLVEVRKPRIGKQKQ